MSKRPPVVMPKGGIVSRSSTSWCWFFFGGGYLEGWAAWSPYYKQGTSTSSGTAGWGGKKPNSDNITASGRRDRWASWWAFIIWCKHGRKWFNGSLIETEKAESTCSGSRRDEQWCRWNGLRRNQQAKSIGRCKNMIEYNSSTGDMLHDSGWL